MKNINVDITARSCRNCREHPAPGKIFAGIGRIMQEGSRRYLESLSTYTRRRMTECYKHRVDEVLYVPRLLALHQRQVFPESAAHLAREQELLNSLEINVFQAGIHRCPNGRTLPTPKCGSGTRK